jgi:phage repressor protein C with HTH and peptisase S24 domain
MVASLGDRLAEAMKERKVTTSALATGVGLSYQGIRKILRNETKEMEASTCALIAKFLDIDAEWLRTGKGTMNRWSAPPQDDLEIEFAGTVQFPKQIPVVGTARMGDNGFYEEISGIPGAGDGHIEISTKDPNAYGLRVRGQSMYPAIRDGWYVLIEPNGQPREGEYVLLKLLDGRKMVKEFLFRRPGIVEVASVNGAERHVFDVTELESMQAVGAVVSPSKWRPD